MERRAFLTLVGGGLLAAPLAAGAQQAGKIARVGDLFVGPPLSPQEMARRGPSAVSVALKELGWVESQNLVYDRRLVESDDQARVAVADMVRLKTDVIITWSNSLAKLVQTETKTVPIVVVGAGLDLVVGGLAASLARPGGNLTGLQILSADLISKRLDLLRVLVPTLSRVGFLKDRVVSTPEGHASYMQSAALASRALRGRPGRPRSLRLLNDHDCFPNPAGVSGERPRLDVVHVEHDSVLRKGYDLSHTPTFNDWQPVAVTIGRLEVQSLGSCH